MWVPTGTNWKHICHKSTKLEHIYDTGTNWEQLGTYMRSRDQLGPVGYIYEKQGSTGTNWEHVRDAGTNWDQLGTYKRSGDQLRSTENR